MTATPDAIVSWGERGWRTETGPCISGGRESAVDAMFFAETQVGRLRWEHAGPHTFHGFAADTTVAPAPVVDPAADPTPEERGSDPTPEEWGSDPTPEAVPPSADHAFGQLRKERAVRRCTEPGCDNKHRARGLCSTHYARRYKKAGTLPSPGTPRQANPAPAPAKDPHRIAYGAAAAPARVKPGVTAESLGFPAGAPIRWPEDWTTTPDTELGRIAAAALARCSGDRREARRYLGCGQASFDRALRIARDLGLA